MVNYLCENCYESVREPICEECQLRELEIWLAEKGYAKINRAVILRRIQKDLAMQDDNLPAMEPGFCIICNKEHMFSCPFCFNSETLRVLKKFHAKENLLLDFSKVFSPSGNIASIVLAKVAA